MDNFIPCKGSVSFNSLPPSYDDDYKRKVIRHTRDNHSGALTACEQDACDRFLANRDMDKTHHTTVAILINTYGWEVTQ